MNNQKQKKEKYNKKQILTIVILAVVVVAIIAALFVADYVKENKNDDALLTQSTDQAETEIPPEEQMIENSSPFDPSTVFMTAQDLEGLEYETVKATMTDGQTFTMQIYPEIAPESAANFLKLVSEGFYDGLTFHRVIEGFMAQGGDPEGTGMGGSDQTIYGEFADNGYYNPLSHQRGVVSMARSNDPNSASSQFFICYDDVSADLDGKYAAFGIVTEGMETIDSFLSEGTDEENDKPLKDVRIASMVIAE